MKKLMGRNDVEDALLRLDSLTKEECLMVAARNLDVTHHVDRVIRDVHGNLKATRKLTEDIDDNILATKTLTEDVCQKVNVIEWVTRNVDNNVKVSKHSTNDVRRSQLREKLRTWLSPPDPSINHNAACATQHGGTAKWFIQGSVFRKWRENSPLLWIQGNPGAGKSVLCSAIIEDIENTREAASPLIAYYYFDFKDASKRDVRGLLASLLFQLGDYTDRYWDVLHRLYTACREGTQQPSEAALAKCLKTMLELSDRVPIFIILDALDECPSHTGTPSAREKVLDFVEDLVRSKHANLSMCITSRPEQDIQAVLNPLISASSRISLHEESGQREDINNYIRSFVYSDRVMRRWREEDKELVIRTLSEKANGMFRWVYCQLDTLRRCMPSSLHKALNKLPTTLDDTYEQTLEGIPKEQWQHAHRFFQCLVAAVRPLRVEELAEIFAVEFDLDAVPNLVEDWRPENPEEAVMSTCSTLITVVEDGGSRYFQFSHFSVKEFLTSDRLRTSDVGSIRQYYISLDSAHITLVRACIAVLLRLDEKMDKKRLATFPLAFYAAHHWVEHAKFGDAMSQIQSALERLFDPRKPYLASWAWIHDVDRSWVQPSIHALAEHPSPLGPTALYYAVLCGFGGLAKHLVAHAEDANARCGYHGTALHAALCTGDLEVAHVLLDHGANANLKDQDGRVPLVKAYDRRNLEAMRLLLKHGANGNVRYDSFELLSHHASYRGRDEVIQLLLEHNFDSNARDSKTWTPLHWASTGGHAKVVQLLLDYGADVDAQLMNRNTPLHQASRNGRLEVVRTLLVYGADMHIRGEFDWTPFQMATFMGHGEVAQLLLECGAGEEEFLSSIV